MVIRRVSYLLYLVSVFSITEYGVLGYYRYNKTNYMIPRQIRINTSVSNVLQYTLLNFEWLPTDPVKHVKYLGLECLQTHFIKFRRFYMKQNVWYNQTPWILKISTVSCIHCLDSGLQVGVFRTSNFKSPPDRTRTGL